MYRKWTIIVASILAVVFIALILSSSYQQAVEIPVSERASKEVVDETVQHQETIAEETEPAIPARTHVIVADSTGSVESIMQEKHSSGSLTYTSREYPTLGSFLESIDGLKNQNGFYWMLYVNGSSSSVGMSHANVVPGDRIEWRYE